MFGLFDLISLVISAFIILPLVIFIREMGYVVVSGLFGVENPRLTIGSGPRLFKFGMFDIRKYYHLYSWFSYDDLKRKSNFAYICIYASPILTNIVFGVTINSLVANGFMEEYATFWDRFIFYAFYYVLFDIVPMKTTNGRPNNGLIIYEMIRYGRRTDYNQEPFIPATTEVEKEYQEEMEEIEEIKEHEQEEIEEKKDEEKERIEDREGNEQREEELKEEKEREEEQEKRESEREKEQMKEKTEAEREQEKEEIKEERREE